MQRSKRISRLGIAGLVTAAALIVVGGASARPRPRSRSGRTGTARPAVEKVAGAWAASKGLGVEVVEKDFGKIRDDLKTVPAENAPDVIIGAHDWTGELAGERLVLPLFPTKAPRGSSRSTRSTRSRTAPRSSGSTAPGRDREHRPVRQHEAREGPEELGRVPDPGAGFKRRTRRRSPSPSSRAPAGTRTTCIRSSRACAATSSARTRAARSTRPTSASRTGRS